MAELTSNETVEYIRALESDVQRYRREVQSERRKMHDLRIALESSQRASIPSPWGSALGGATRDYRNLSASAPVAFPSKWGHPLGLADTSAATGCRPGTAPEHLKTLNRPPAKRMSTPPAQTARLPSGAGSFGYRTRVSSAAEPGPSLPSAVNTRPQP